MAKRQRKAEKDVPADLSIPIGQVVKNWREYRGMSVTDLAKRAKLTKGYLSLLEHNRIYQPRREQLTKLADALEISSWDLIARRMPTGRKNEPAKKRAFTDRPGAISFHEAPGPTAIDRQSMAAFMANTETQLRELEDELRELRKLMLEVSQNLRGLPKRREKK